MGFHTVKESGPDSSIYTLAVRAKSSALHFVATEIRLGFSPSENNIEFEQKSWIQNTAEREEASESGRV